MMRSGELRVEPLSVWVQHHLLGGLCPRGDVMDQLLGNPQRSGRLAVELSLLCAVGPLVTAECAERHT